MLRGSRKIHKELPMSSISKWPPSPLAAQWEPDTCAQCLKHTPEGCSASRDMPSFSGKDLSRWEKCNWPTCFSSFYSSVYWCQVTDYSHHKSYVPFHRDSHFRVWDLDKWSTSQQPSIRPTSLYFSVFNLPKSSQMATCYQKTSLHSQEQGFMAEQLLTLSVTRQPRFLWVKVTTA